LVVGEFKVMTDEEFILQNMESTTWWSELMRWIARGRTALPQALFALTDDDMP
jgi:hypothetical protein